MNKQICLKVMFLTELNPGFKVIQGNGRLGNSTTGNTHQNSPVVEETGFVSSDSMQQILLSKCKQYRSAGERIQATKQTTRPAKEVYRSVSAF